MKKLMYAALLLCTVGCNAPVQPVQELSITVNDAEGRKLTIVSMGGNAKSEEMIAEGTHYSALMETSPSGFYHLVSIKDNANWMPPIRDCCTVGHNVRCLHCGEYNITHSELMVCDECADELGLVENEEEEYTYCDCCGRRILLEESIEVDACGEVICHQCINETFVCDKCGCRDFISNLHYDRENDINVCINCRMEDYE
jgi:hypothetical protein